MWLQTLGAEKRAAEYPRGTDNWVKVTAPQGHITVISSPYFNLRGSCWFTSVTLYKGGKTPKDKVWKGCWATSPGVLVIQDARVVHVHFDAKRSEPKGQEGFRLLFTFHEVSCKSLSAPRHYEALS